MIMTGIRRLRLVTMALVLALAALVTVYPQQKPNKPTPGEKLSVCDCYFPNSKEYGVKKDGKCIVTKCQKKTPEKKDS